MNKFANFPSVNMTSLRESVNRRQFMESQFEKYGIKKFNYYLTDRWTEIHQHSNVSGEYMHLSDIVGSVVSHLSLLRNWYTSTNEDYALFCDDDISFETSDYWNFTWDEFMQTLPSNWECVQTIRMQTPPAPIGLGTYDSVLKLFWGRWWGTCALMKRSYVKKVLDRHFRGYNTINCSIADSYPEYEDPNLWECVENVLYTHKGGVVYNFPLFVFTESGMESTYIRTTDEKKEHARVLKMSCQVSRETFLHLWATQGSNLNLKEALVPA